MPGTVPICILIHLIVKIKWAHTNSFAIFQMKKLRSKGELSTWKEEN